MAEVVITNDAWMAKEREIEQLKQAETRWRRILNERYERLKADYERNAEAYGRRLSEADHLSAQCRKALDESRAENERLRLALLAIDDRLTEGEPDAAHMVAMNALK